MESPRYYIEHHSVEFYAGREYYNKKYIFYCIFSLS